MFTGRNKEDVVFPQWRVCYLLTHTWNRQIIFYIITVCCFTGGIKILILITILIITPIWGEGHVMWLCVGLKWARVGRTDQIRSILSWRHWTPRTQLKREKVKFWVPHTHAHTHKWRQRKISLSSVARQPMGNHPRNLKRAARGPGVLWVLLNRCEEVKKRLKHWYH